MHLVGFFISFYHDARSPERKILHNVGYFQQNYLHSKINSILGIFPYQPFLGPRFYTPIFLW